MCPNAPVTGAAAPIRMINSLVQEVYFRYSPSSPSLLAQVVLSSRVNSSQMSIKSCRAGVRKSRKQRVYGTTDCHLLEVFMQPSKFALKDVLKTGYCWPHFRYNALPVHYCDDGRTTNRS